MSLIRCSRSIAQPSVTELSPSRRNSTGRSGETWAKCSAWPASWKKACQSSGPPIGLMTSITRSGTSIGAQNARGLFFGRGSRSRWTFSWERRSIPRPSSVHSSAATMRSPGKPSSHSLRAEDTRDVEAPRLLERHAGAAAQERVERGHVELLGLGEEGAALLGELVEREPEAVVELEIARSAEGARALAPLLVQRGPARGQLLLRERDARRVELFALAAVGLVRDRGAEHPVRDVLAVDARRERRLEAGDLLGLGSRQVAEVALAGEPPELALAVAVRAGRLGQPGRGLERRQVGEALVDRLELEPSFRPA